MRAIRITCNSAHLSDIEHQLKIEDGDDILDNKEDGIWLLNGGLIIEKGAALTIDSKDTKWLKIIADGKIAYPIQVLGSLKIEYLGGDNSVLKNNNIHDLYFAFYSNGVGGMVIENNHIHNNGHYGLDPHTGTHDMLIRNNTVHDNGSTGIICSLNCHNIIIENNTAYNNNDIGIMFSRNMTNSIARNNIVYNETQGIFISKSHNNEIYNNTVYDTKNAIYLKNMSSNNLIHDNIIKNPRSSGIQVKTGASANTFYSNAIIINPSKESKAIVVENETSKDNIFKDNKVTGNSSGQ